MLSVRNAVVPISLQQTLARILGYARNIGLAGDGRIENISDPRAPDTILVNEMRFWLGVLEGLANGTHAASCARFRIKTRATTGGLEIMVEFLANPGAGCSKLRGIRLDLSRAQWAARPDVATFVVRPEVHLVGEPETLSRHAARSRNRVRGTSIKRTVPTRDRPQMVTGAV